MPGTESVTYRSPAAAADAAKSRDGRWGMFVEELAGDAGSERECALGHRVNDGGPEPGATWRGRTVPEAARWAEPSEHTPRTRRCTRLGAGRMSIDREIRVPHNEAPE